MAVQFEPSLWCRAGPAEVSDLFAMGRGGAAPNLSCRLQLATACFEVSKPLALGQDQEGSGALPCAMQRSCHQNSGLYFSVLLLAQVETAAQRDGQR